MESLLKNNYLVKEACCSFYNVDDTFLKKTFYNLNKMDDSKNQSTLKTTTFIY